MGVRVCVLTNVCALVQENVHVKVCVDVTVYVHVCVWVSVFEHYDMCDKCACVHECGGAYACVERAGLHESGVGICDA